jgi:hypothetical protein
MTERKSPWSKEQVRAVAWVAGSATLFTGVAVVGALPRGPSSPPVAKAQGVKKAKTQTRKVYVITGAGGGGAPVSFSNAAGAK